MLITTDNNSQQLYYNQSHNGSTPQWGGNISAMDWQAAEGMQAGASPTAGKLRGYSFSYDGLSRLTQADYHENNTRSNRYDTRYTYDLMGNMLTLQRNGLHNDGEFSIKYNGKELDRHHGLDWYDYGATQVTIK